MKNRMFVGLVAAATALVLSSSLAAAQEAYSANAIGVIKKTLPAGKLVSISVPLDQESDEGQGFTFGSVPAITNLPNGTIANFWDVTNQKWVSQGKTAKAGWGAQQNRLIAPGECFFIKNNQSTNIELIISGEVPSDASISRGLPVGALQSVANPYPVPMVFSNFTFAAALPNGSIANFWDEANQKWVSQGKTAKAGWGAQQSREIAPGEGFFVKPNTNSTVTTWTEVRPYTWPN